LRAWSDKIGGRGVGAKKFDLKINGQAHLYMDPTRQPGRRGSEQKMVSQRGKKIYRLF